jgi:hypothetical protein
MSRWDLITVELLEELKAAMEARLQVAKDFVGDNNTPLITLAYLVEELQEAYQKAKYKVIPRMWGTFEMKTFLSDLKRRNRTMVDCLRCGYGEVCPLSV